MRNKTKQNVSKPFTFDTWLKESIFETSDRLKEELPEYKELLIKIDKKITGIEGRIRKAKNPEELSQIYTEESRLYSAIQIIDHKSVVSRAVTYPVLKDIIESMKQDQN